MVNQQTILVFPEQVEARVRAAMKQSRSDPANEALGFLMCERIQLATEVRYVVREWFVPRPDECVTQGIGGVTLSPEAHRAFLQRLLGSGGLHPVHLHTHPGEQNPQFSTIDDHNERAYANALRQLPGQFRLLSGVYNYSLTSFRFRQWVGRSSQEVVTQRSWLLSHHGIVDDGSVMSTEMFDRQRIFGEGLQKELDRLTIGLVGAGGLGAIFAEFVARLGIRRWVLVDPDRLELTNLNRAPFATKEMADSRIPKTEHVSALINQFWGASATVETVNSAIPNARAIRLLKKANILVVTTDNHQSRLDMLKLALSVGKPILSIGTYIDKPQYSDSPRIFGRVTLPPLGGGWCFVCGGAISLREASFEQADPITRERLRQEGYLADVDAPAVYWVNGATAGIAAGVLHGLVTGYSVPSNGIDRIIDYAQGTWLNVDHDLTYRCYVCGMGESIGFTSNLDEMVSQEPEDSKIDSYGFTDALE